jgi:hypothetical protein
VLHYICYQLMSSRFEKQYQLTKAQPSVQLSSAHCFAQVSLGLKKLHCWTVRLCGTPRDCYLGSSTYLDTGTVLLAAIYAVLRLVARSDRSLGRLGRRRFGVDHGEGGEQEEDSV